MNCSQPVTVNLAAIEWLKTKYPELSIKAGLCERVAGRIYIKTLSRQGPQQPLPDHEIVTMYDENPRSDGEMIAFARAVEQAHGITPATVEKEGE